MDVPSKLPPPPFASWAKSWVAANTVDGEKLVDAKARARAVWNATPPPEERAALEEAFLAERVAYYKRYSDQPENAVAASKYSAKLDKLKRAGGTKRSAPDDRSDAWDEVVIGKKTFYKHETTGEVAHKLPYRDEAAARAACAPRKFTAKTAFAHDNKELYGNTRVPAFKEALKAKLATPEGLKELEERAAELNRELGVVPAAPVASEAAADDYFPALGGEEDDEEFS
jgi:hypothetical protein